RSSTSSGGRFQFSVEKAYTASESTPRSIAASTVRRSAFVPARCPAAMGRPRLRAHRALPSMMIATAWAASGSSGSGAGRAWRSVLIFVRRLMPLSWSPSAAKVLPSPAESAEHFSRRLDLHDLRFFVPEEIVDRLRVVVGQLLHALLSAALVVAADLLVRRELLEVVHGVPPDVSHRNPPLLRDLPHDLDELLAALLRRLRHGQTDHLPVVGRRQTEI